MNSPTCRPRAILAFAAAFALLSWSVAGGPLERTVLAAGPGNLVLKTPTVDEKNGEWHVKVRIDLPRPPSMMHTPMRFTFSKEAVDERAIMVRGAEPEHHRVVLETPAKQIVGLDIDFADASGKVFKSTIFEFDLKRADGYFEAGEYVMGLSGPDGDVGNNQHITLKGDNPPVYRGAMDFSDNKSTKQKGPKLQAVSNGLDGGGGEVAQNDTPAAATPVGGDVAAVGSAPDMIPKDSYNRTAEEETVHEHPGCGCVTAGLGGGSGPLAVIAALGATVVVGARRRRK
ncbi:MAG TPA: hypothetical protein VGM06_14940 [Polyangiaceae bacterium]|jgi:hypothetical protein